MSASEYLRRSRAWCSACRCVGDPRERQRLCRREISIRRTGRGRGAHDLIIAAHAAETGRTILSSDAKARFGDLPAVLAIAP